MSCIKGVSPSDYTILKKHVLSPLLSDGFTIWLFGSRARGDYDKYSDVDLLVKGHKSKFREIISKIREDIEESNFSYKVDIVFVDDLATSYRKKVESELVEIMKKWNEKKG